jgi:hypothetical protein
VDERSNGERDGGGSGEEVADEVEVDILLGEGACNTLSNAVPDSRFTSSERAAARPAAAEAAEEHKPACERCEAGTRRGEAEGERAGEAMEGEGSSGEPGAENGEEEYEEED